MRIIALVLFLSACGAPQRGEPGPPGPAGEAGAPGPTGATGPTGTAGSATLSAHVRCTKSAVGLTFMYSSSLFSNGLRYVDCEIASGAIGIASSALYSSDQVGSQVGGCFIDYDMDAASAGFWYFTLSPRQAQYKDAPSASNLQVVSFADTDCTF